MDVLGVKVEGSVEGRGFMENGILGKGTKVIVLLLIMNVMMSRLCACAQSMTTAVDGSAVMLSDKVMPPPRIALLLPSRSGVFGAAADAVRTGFLTASERAQGSLIITMIETADAVADILATYHEVSAKYDIIVGPLSRGAVTALMQSTSVVKPTIALTPPDTADGAERYLPSQMLMMGLSIEDEARQVADWVEREKTPGKIFAIATKVAWQHRAAQAFAVQARHSGLMVESLEVSMDNHVLNAGGLAQLNQRIQAEKPALLFVALDAGQAIQLRHAIGSMVPLYGISQLNPLALVSPGGDMSATNRLPELNGVRLVDLPWQLQADHPAVMAYPRLGGDADLERLYALGIDAFHVARALALQHSGFNLDGATGQLNANMSAVATYFQRRETQAVYQDGIVVPITNQR